MEEVLKEGNRLYKKGGWDESINFLEKNRKFLIKDNETAELEKIIGWSRYYKGIKCPEEEKNINIQDAVNNFKTALSLLTSLLLSEKEKEKDTEISVRNGLSLSLWILGKKKEAELESFKATEKFPHELSAWNTRSILLRWAGDFKTSVNVCERVYQTAVAKKDFRTAGHGKQNKGDALVKLGKTTEAKEDYKKALEMYKKYEKKTGESANFHLKRVQEKLSSL